MSISEEGGVSVKPKCEHDMVWKCRKCGIVVDSKHSHKTCINKFETRVKAEVRRCLGEGDNKR